jgi:NTP pyrophosphatase (non-canonical NTP hydrolase)
MNTDNNSELKERVIELSYYITKAINDNQPEKVEALREEMNDVIDVILNKSLANDKRI